MAHFNQPLGASVERVLHLLAEASPRPEACVFRNKLPIQPGRAVAADLPVKVEHRQCADREILGSGRRVIGHAPLGDVGGDFPVVGVDALDMAGAAQGFQPADMGADEGVRVAVAAFDDVPRGFQMLARPVDAAIGFCHELDVEVRGPRLGLGRDGIERDDMPSPDLVQAGASAVST